METTVGWIVVLGLTLLAHLEAGHRGRLPIVRDVLDDRVAWSAIGAVSEWIAEAAIQRIAEVVPAVVTGADIGRNQHEVAGPRNALPNQEL